MLIEFLWIFEKQVRGQFWFACRFFVDLWWFFGMPDLRSTAACAIQTQFFIFRVAVPNVSCLFSFGNILETSEQHFQTWKTCKNKACRRPGYQNRSHESVLGVFLFCVRLWKWPRVVPRSLFGTVKTLYPLGGIVGLILFRHVLELFPCSLLLLHLLLFLLCRWAFLILLLFLRLLLLLVFAVFLAAPDDRFVQCLFFVRNFLWTIALCNCSPQFYPSYPTNMKTDSPDAM